LKSSSWRINLKKILFAFFIFHFSLFICYSADFGLLVNQNAAVSNQDSEEAGFEYQANLLPRLFLQLGDSSSLFISAGITLEVKDEFSIIPELLRTEYTYRSGNWGIRAGRMQYADPLGFIAAGLFDGVSFSFNSRSGSLSAGAWYTGLLYKKNAVITMSAAEQASHDAPVDYGNFSNTYFAPKRLLISLDWEHPSVAELLLLKAALSAQTDLTDGDEKYHSQYLTLKASMPVKSFTFELGGSFSAAEFEPAMADKNFNIAFAWDLGVFWTPPTSFTSRLSLTGRFAGGNTDGIVGAFVPLTGKYCGNILRAKLSGISVLGLDYTARLTRTFGASLAASHFVRNDQGTYTAYPASATHTNYFLGTELFARLVWSPFSDLQLTLGGGAFLPSLGDVNPDEKAQWRVELTAVFSAY
jgi:hypothetical protein